MKILKCIPKSKLPPRLQILLRDRFGAYRDPEMAILNMLPEVPGEIVIDIGANRGIWTYRLRRLVGKGGLLIAFEANPNCFQYLKQAFAHDRRVECFNLAITDSVGYVEIFANPTETELLHSGTTLKPINSMVMLDKVPGTTLDSFMSSRFSDRDVKVGLIKVDTEGGEIEVIKGSLQIIESSAPILIVEVLHRNRESNLKSIQLLLEGYECFLFEDSKFIKFEKWNFSDLIEFRPRSRNYVFVPRNKYFEFIP